MTVEHRFKPFLKKELVLHNIITRIPHILDEARKGYDALVIRRRGGAQQFLPLVLGSVSTRLVEKTDCLPIFLAGTQAGNHRLCIAIDGSEGSLRAAEYTADFVRDSDCRIFLCSIIRGIPEFDTINGELEKGINDMVEKITDVFKRANIPEKNISFKSIKGSQSRADAIVKTADKENCDTVVFGRRGISDYRGFEIGRVPWKVIHGAQHLTVWMVP